VKSLVTGARGFVGRHLVAHLEACGDTVIETDLMAGGPDLADAAAMLELIDGVRPECIYHLAGWADVGGSWDHPREAFEANANGTLNVLEAARQTGVDRILNIGSADVYGKVQPEDLPITETHPLNPATPYAASKIAAEYLGIQAHNGHDLDVISVRAFNHIGPGQSDKFVAPALALRVARNERDRVDSVEVGNLEPRRDLTDVRDVVRAYRMVVADGVPGQIYNVCSGRVLAIREVADFLIGQAQTPMQLAVDPALQRRVDTPVLEGSHQKLTAATGWEPTISTEQSLEDLMADCRARVSAEIAPAPPVS
jgi:GDP-4-dehydro-6-deoxy-D-mannose reductase